MKFRHLFLLLVFLLTCVSAHAQVRLVSEETLVARHQAAEIRQKFAQLTQTGAGRKPGATYTGPLDVIGISNAADCYSLWACSVNYIGGAHVSIQVKRASDSQTCDVGISSVGYIGLLANCSGSANGSTLSAFCNSTTCRAPILYSQKGISANNLTVQTGGGTYFNSDGALLVFNEYGTLLGLDTMSIYAEYQTTGFTITSGQPFSISSIIYLGTAGAGGQSIQWLAGFGSCCQSLGYAAGGNVLMNAGGTTQSVSISVSALHLVLGTFNGSSSSVNVDGTLTSISTPGTNGLNAKFTVGSADGYNYPFFGYFMEIIPIATNLSTGSTGLQAQLCANQAARTGNGAACGD